MSSTDLEAAAELLIIDTSPEPVADEAEERDTAPEAEDVTDEGETAEAEADDNEAEEPDESTEDSDSEEQPQAALHTVKVDGVEKQVTLDELKRAYSGQDYIQKGMKEAADQRKQAAEAFAALQAEQQQFIQTVQSIQQGGLKQPPKAPDPASLSTDPIGYMQARAEYDAKMSEYNAQQAQIQDMQRRYSASQEQAKQQHLREQSAQLAAAIPEFSDPEKGPKMRKALFNTGLKDYGFSEQEMSNITDARAVQVLRDAMLWRELQRGTAEAKKVPKPPKSVKPAARREQPANVAMKKKKERLQRTGSREAFAAYLLDPNG